MNLYILSSARVRSAGSQDAIQCLESFCWISTGSKAYNNLFMRAWFCLTCALR